MLCDCFWGHFVTSRAVVATWLAEYCIQFLTVLFFDVRVFNPHAPSNKNQMPSAYYRKHEKEKKRAYEQRICEVEHSSFTPLVFLVTGGMGREATCFYKHLASMLAQKWDHPYCTTWNLVAKVSSDLPHLFNHPSPTRSKILSRPSHPSPSSHRPCHH